MKFLVAIAVLAMAASSYAEEIFEEGQLENQARFLYFNTSSTATSLTLLGALILLGVIAYLVYAGGLLGASGYNRAGYEQYANQDYYNHEAYSQFRSNDAASEFNPMKIIEWIGVFREMYDNFDYNDLECQKRLICDVMKNSDKLGAGAQKIKSGFRAAKFLEVLALPEDLRELLDEYLDADRMSETGKDCSEYFQCPFSLKDSARSHLTENHLF